MLGRPDVLVAGSQVHRRVVKGPGEGRPVPEHDVEVALVHAQPNGQNPQYPTLQVQDRVVERHEDLGGPGQVLVGQGRIAVAVGVAQAQRMPSGYRRTPVEHLLEVRHVGYGGRLHQQARVAGLPVGSRYRAPVLAVLGEREEGSQATVGIVQ